MQDIEDKLYRLGIPAKTKHNEVAPGQFELAPYFEAANVAADHQQTIMTTLKATAKEHGFMCLLHEKPFAGINGSGKHVNWSVGNATQGNLLDPGSTPAENLNFLLFCGAVIRGVHQHGPLLRAAIASAANDHRLISTSLEAGKMDLGLDQIIAFDKEAGDRNRTSPFAFTGNRFEFRAVGSSASVSGPLVVMNTMLADSLEWIAEKLEAALSGGADKPAAVLAVLKELMELHGNAVFGGDGYSSEWHTAAVEERGLKNIPTTADALPAYNSPEVKALFESTGVLSATELASRYEVYAEQYVMSIEVEAKLVVEMAKTSIFPAAVSYLSTLADTAGDLDDLGIKLDDSAAKVVASEANAMMAAVAKLSTAMEKEDFASTDEHTQFLATEVRGLMDEVRAHADALEGEVSDDLWPLPKYREMLFIK